MQTLTIEALKLAVKTRRDNCGAPPHTIRQLARMVGMRQGAINQAFTGHRPIAPDRMDAIRETLPELGDVCPPKRVEISEVRSALRNAGFTLIAERDRKTGRIVVAAVPSQLAELIEALEAAGFTAKAGKACIVDVSPLRKGDA